MKITKINNIALVIKTTGLDYDDRVRKEILTIRKLYPNISFKIFAMLPENKEYEGVTSYGVSYKSLYLPSRGKYPSGKKMMLKSWEFYKVVAKELKAFDAIWCGDYHSFVVAALAPKKYLLWDLHELPTPLLGNALTRELLKYIFNRCKVVIHANPQRAEYLNSLGLINDTSKHYAIRNYPNFDDVDTEYDEKYKEFVAWKKERKCVYLQGLSDYGRAGYESIKAVLGEKDLVSVVVGNVYTPDREKLEKEYGATLNERIFFAGKIKQMKIPQYVRECVTSLVFYQNIRPNNWFCEANRFYQSVIMGLPVIVGNNPPMRDIVEKYGFGISIDDDGCDIQKIGEGMKALFAKYDYYKANVVEHKDCLTWDKQESVFEKVVSKLLEEQ